MDTQYWYDYNNIMKTDTCGGEERGCGVVDGLAFHLEGKNKLSL